MEKLKSQLDILVQSLSQDEKDNLEIRLMNLMVVYPFNEYEFIISTLLGLKKITLDDYYAIRDEYMGRNLYLHVYEISAPRTFGEAWAQGQLKSIVPLLEKPTKKKDSNYSGQYDFYLDELGGIKIEVKASRAVDSGSNEALYMKALASDSNKRFNMNFQQIKPDCCTVMVWIGVWRDKIRYWVLSSKEVANNRYYSIGQHRGNVGEGQLWVTNDNISEFDKYEVQPDKLFEEIKKAHVR